MILGTAAYMSPEQAKGRQADKRSDVWAFGAVLYEMLSGQRAFKGDDIADTLAAVLRQDIDWTALPASTPAPVRRLIARCLDRDVRRRLRDIGEARIVLDDPAAPARGDAGGVPALAPPQPLWRRAIPVVLSAIVAGVLASAATVYLRPSPAPLVVTRFPFMLGEGQSFSRTLQPPSRSPSRRTARRWPTRANGAALPPVDVGARGSPDSQEPTRHRRFVSSPVFSPDSQSVAFWSSADQTLKKVAVSGGAAVTICRADQPFGMSWGTDGIVFGQGRKGIMRVSANGGTPEVLVRVKDGEQAHGPQMLPGGETVLFTLATGTAVERWDKAQIVTQSLRSGERKTLVDGGSDARYVPTGHLVYAIGRNRFARPDGRSPPGGDRWTRSDRRRRQATGREITGAAQFGFSSTGSLIYVPGPVSTTAAQSDLALIDRKGGVEPLKLPPGPYQHPRASPNGTQIAFATDDGKEAIVWIYDLGGTSVDAAAHVRRQEPFSDLVGGRPARRVPVGSRRRPRHLLAAGGRLRRRRAADETGSGHIPRAGVVVAEGRAVPVRGDQGVDVSLWTFSLRTRKPLRSRTCSHRTPSMPRFHPTADGSHTQSPKERATGIYVQPFPATGAKYQVSKSSAIDPVWSRDGQELVSQPAGRPTGRPDHHDPAELFVQRSGAHAAGIHRTLARPPRGTMT